MTRTARITGSQIKARRERLGLSQKALAELFATDQNTIARWETERRVPGLTGMIALAFSMLEHLDRLAKGISRWPEADYPAPSPPVQVSVDPETLEVSITVCYAPRVPVPA